MNSRLWQNPWRLMLAVNVAVLIGVFLHKITLPPYVPYIHLLADYHFGFTKRALIGAGVSFFTSKVPVWLVFALAGAAWLVTLGLFIELFRRTFGFDERNMPLFVLMAGSPFFLKNFMHTLGHFDIYGCALAIGLLLIPARSVVFVVIAALFSIVLILIHHIHFLMYVPTIAVIVVLRYYLVQGFTRANALVGLAANPGSRFCSLSSKQDDRSVAHRPAEFQLRLVPAALQGAGGYLGTDAIEPAGRAGVCAADLAAYPAVAIFFRADPRIVE
jgi:hypothetical protein